MERVAVLPNERIGTFDYEEGAGGRLVQNDQFREVRSMSLPDGRATGIAATVARVLGGWAWSPIVLGTDSTARLNRGTGVFPFINDQGLRKFGLVFGDEGAASVVLDFATAAISSTQSVYVRAVATNATFRNRVFWNPSTAAEFTDNMATRLVVGWEATFQDASAAPPGNGEWVKLYNLTINGSGKISAVADLRHMYFEGDAASTPTAFASEWGSGANDRNADRALYGVKDEHMWAQAVRSQLKSIVGPSWYGVPKISLKTAGDLKDRFVTVDWPLGAAGNGDYPTLAAAVTAVEAMGGGHILLRGAGATYDVSTEIEISTPISIVATDGKAYLTNVMGAGSTTPMLHYQTGSAGSELQGLQIIAGFDPGEVAVRVSENGGRGVVIDRCDIHGQVLINNGRAELRNTKLQSSFATAIDSVLKFSGACHVQIDNVRIVNDSAPNAVYVGALGPDTDDEESFIQIKNLFIRSSIPTQPAWYAATGGDYACDFDGFQVVGGCPEATMVSLLSGRYTGRAMSLRFLNSLGTTWSANALNVAMTGVFDFCEIRGLNIDCDGQLALMGGWTSGIAAHLSGRDVTIRDLRVGNAIIPNTTTDGSSTALVVTDPATNGVVRVLGGRFSNISNEATGTVSAVVIGKPSASVSAETGSVHITDVVFDMTGVTTVAGLAVVYLTGGVRSNVVNNNIFIGGAFDSGIRLVSTGGDVSGNTFRLAPSVTPFWSRAIYCSGDVTSGSELGQLRMTNNTGHFTAMRAGWSDLFFVSGYNLAVVSNNLESGSGTAPSVSGVRVINCTIAVINGNGAFETTTGAGNTAQIPATLGDTNA